MPKTPEDLPAREDGDAEDLPAGEDGDAEGPPAGRREEVGGLVRDELEGRGHRMRLFSCAWTDGASQLHGHRGQSGVPVTGGQGVSSNVEIGDV